MTVPLKESKPMTTCPTCKSPVRVDRLDKHIRTKHSPITQSANSSKTPSPSINNTPASSKKKMANRIVPNSPKGPSPTRRLPVKDVRCPFCIWIDQNNELPSHIRISHPSRYAAWSRENEKVAKPVPEQKRQIMKTKVKKKDYREEHPTKVKCPICFGEIKKVSYFQHLAKAHAGKSVSDYPPIPIFIAIIRVQEPVTTTVTSIRRASGGVKQPIAMNTLNVGRRSKTYIKRK